MTTMADRIREDTEHSELMTKARLYDVVAKERTHFSNIVDEALKIMNDINDHGLNTTNCHKLYNFIQKYD